MTEQKAPDGIEWTRVYGRRGYTANAVKGCQHDCKWEMPGGVIAGCYAKALVEKFRLYGGVFERIQWDEAELLAIDRLKPPAGIFIDSMSDLFGRGVPPENIKQVLACVARNPRHVCFSLTKNAPNLLSFPELPENLWVGVSSPPTFMFGHRLTQAAQFSFVIKALDVLAKVNVPIRWMSVEPLAFDIACIFEEWQYRNQTAPFPLQWIVIGAASIGHKYFQPSKENVSKLLAFCDSLGIKVFFKGNLQWDPWREEFPPEQKTETLKQESLL